MYIELTATASSSLDVTFELVGTENPATLEGTTLTITGDGVTQVKAIQAGNFEYNTTEITKSISTTKLDQTITFTLPSSVYVNDVLDLTATASSGLEISYELVSGAATLDTEAMTLTPTAEGTVEIKASQAGNDDYNAATDVILTVTAVKQDQSIDFTLG